MRGRARRGALRVRDGRVLRKNNWKPDHRDYYALPQADIQIERAHPGPGYRHVVTVPQVRDFLGLLPDWDELAVGLRAISLWEGSVDRLGLWNPGVVVLNAWDQDLWWDNTHVDWVDKNQQMLELLNVEIVQHGEQRIWLELRWTEAQARAFSLLDVLVHELGHHHDWMTNAGEDASRGEPYAEAYVRRVQQTIWPAYAARFDV
ncbi:MAG: hypothetical protein ACJ762_06470 [Solirubrobacteraceae bacterium]